MLYGWLFPLDLAPDESYYWDWSRNPDFGYFSKPPLIAWLMGLISLTPGFGAGTIKATAALLTSVSLVLIYEMGRRVLNTRIAGWGTLLLAALPGNSALSLFLTIDPPLLAFWTAALLLSWKRWESITRGISRDGGGYGLLLSLAFGLGLLTKQMMLVFPLCLLIFAVAQAKTHPRIWRSAALWWPFALGASFLLLPLIWNIRNNWETLTHTAHHFEGAAGHWTAILVRWGEFFASQLGLMGPVVGLLFFFTAVRIVRHFRQLEEGAVFLTSFSFIPLGCILLLPFRQELQANWALVFYPPGLLLLVAVSLGTLSALPSRGLIWLRIGTFVSLALTVILLILPFLLPQTPLAGGRFDPTTRLRGWSEAAKAMAPWLPESARNEIWVDANRQWTSQLAFYLPGRPTAWRWNRPGDLRSQYHLWGRPKSFPDSPFAILSTEETLPSDLQSLPLRIEYRESVEVDLGSGRKRILHLHLAHTKVEAPSP